MNEIARMEINLPRVSGTVRGSDMPGVRRSIESDIDFWHGRTETNPAEQDRLADYWDNIGVRSWTPSGSAWSAAWVSWHLRNQDFPGASAHYQYTKDIIAGGTPWTAYSLAKNPNKIEINVGDVLVKPRPGSSYTGHGDIIYKVAGDKAYLAGGNSSNTAKEVKVIQLNPDGTADIRDFQIILKKARKMPNAMQILGTVAIFGGLGALYLAVTGKNGK